MGTSILTSVRSWLFWLTLAFALVLTLFILGVRLWLFPNIDHFRPWLTTQLSMALDLPVAAGKLEARWRGWQPQVHVRDLVLGAPESQHLIKLPEATGVLSWRSLTAGQIHFSRLHLHGLDVTFFDKEVSVAAEETASLPMHVPAIQWLFEQPVLQLLDSTIRLKDRVDPALSVVWQDVTMSMQNQSGQHKISLTAQAPSGPETRIDVRASLHQSVTSSSHTGLDGELYLRLAGLDAQIWKPWLNLPSGFTADDADVALWVDVKDNALTRLLVDAHVNRPQWQHTEPGIQASAQQGRMLAQTVLHQGWNPSVVTAQLQLRDTHLHLMAFPEIPLFARATSMRASISHDEQGLVLDINDLVLDSPDAQVQGQLRWTNRGQTALGHLDMSLDIPWARLASIGKYMPSDVDEDVRDWLSSALRGGVVEGGHLVLQGALAAFPFDDDQAEGIFAVHAPYRDAHIDYLPPSVEELGWPALHSMHGLVKMEGAGIRISASEALMTPAASGDIGLRQVEAAIPDMRSPATLHVKAQTQAKADVYVDLVGSSPLSALLEHTFDETRAQGVWTVPLELSIPLHSEGTVQVDGRLQMRDTTWQLEPGLPELSQLGGEIIFTQNTVILPGLEGYFLGGPVRLSGGVGPRQPGLQMDGRISAQELVRLSGVSGSQRLSGETAYVARLTGIGPDAAGRPAFQVQSSLEGLGMDFPAPLGKTAEQGMPLTVSWQHGDSQADRVLTIDFDQLVSARFVHSKRVDPSAWFQAGSISVGEKAQWPEQGMSVAISQPVFDLDAWDAITKELTPEHAGGETASLFPKVRYLQLEADQARLLGMGLTDLSYRFWQDGLLDWRADIQSREAVGQLAWIEMDGKPEGPVHAVFERLQIGSPEASDGKSDKVSAAVVETQHTSETATDSDPPNIPAISLQVNHLEFYGMHLGQLALEGVPDATGEAWELQDLSLSAPSLSLEGTGKWQLLGNNRGLTLNIVAQTPDLGAYLDQIGLVNVMAGGQGEASASVQWFDLPWGMDETRLSGDIHFAISDGRLNTVNSDTARLLELLSFQSMQRLTRLDFNPLDLTRDGFPFQVLRGTLVLDAGRLHTSDYQIAGSAGSIVIDGDVALDAGHLDLEAVVVPNLDVSGAAIAAGVVINPIVGLGAFLTQWVLKEPLAEAMAVRYRIGGTWKEPVVEPQKKLVKEAADPVIP